MRRMINFFALQADLLAVLKEVESKRPLRYVLIQDSSSSKLQEWFKVTEIPGLGQAAGEQQALCNKFLVTDWDAPIQLRPHQLYSGETRVSVDQMLNQNCIEMTPAGQWKPHIIISGRFATISDSPAPQTLMRLLARSIRKHFTRVRAFWVGPEAMIGFKHGFRLTHAEQSPVEFDLRASD